MDMTRCQLRFCPLPRQVDIADVDISRGRLENSEEHVDGGGFAGTWGPRSPTISPGCTVNDSRSRAVADP
jgi:hypothetical protein